MFRHSTTHHDFALRDEEESVSSQRFSGSADCDPIGHEARHQTAPLETRPVNDKRRLRLRFGLLLVCSDVAAIAAAILGATLVRFGADFASELGQLMVIILPIYLLVAANGHAFRLGEAIHGNAPIGRGRALMAFLISIGLILGIVFYLKVSQNFSRGALALSLVSGLLALAFARTLFAWLSTHWLPESILQETIIVDGVDVPFAPGATILDAALLNLSPRLDDPAMLDMLGRRIEGADRVIVACRPERRDLWSRALRGAGVSVEVLTPELDAMQAISINVFDGHTTTVVATGPLGHGDRVLKRSLDLAIVLSTLPVTVPLMLVVACAIKLESRGPIFFVQRRIGQGNRLFRMYKFRSMRAASGDRDGVTSTARNDSRVTRVGTLIRRTSIDELPQIINILRGEMSVVGPRPHAIESRAANAHFWDLERRSWDRHAAKPGMTGLAQVRGFRGSISDEGQLASRVKSDLAYLQAWTIWRDLAIIGRTFRVLVHDNAF
jgi:lipopolysaccharide/colanic/teichoic acid biosynthesis glycosyltransferase